MAIYRKMLFPIYCIANKSDMSRHVWWWFSIWTTIEIMDCFGTLSLLHFLPLFYNIKYKDTFLICFTNHFYMSLFLQPKNF